MKFFEIEVEEILSRTVKIKAKDRDEALDKVEKLYKNEKIVLWADDYVCTTIRPNNSN